MGLENNIGKIDIAADLQHGVGCSELAIALGVSSYETAYALWERKVGRAFNKPSTLAMRLGVPLEPIIKALYEERTGRKLRRNRKKFVHPTLPLIGHLDYEVVGEQVLVDAKSSLSFGGRNRYGADGSDELPPEHILQGNGYMMLRGWKEIDFAVLMIGPEFRIFTLKADPEIQAMIEEGLAQFWSHVVNDTPPELTTLDDAARRFPTAFNGGISADPKIAGLLAAYRGVKQEIKDKEAQADAYELIIKEAMGEAEALLDDQDKPLCTWKNSVRSSLDTTRLKNELPMIAEQYLKTTQSRTFRLAKEKTL